MTSIAGSVYAAGHVFEVSPARPGGGSADRIRTAAGARRSPSAPPGERGR